MPRLPTPGADNGTWGTILNDYLSVELDDHGNLRRAGDITAAKSAADSAQSAVAGKYTKPDGGIPAADLSTAVNNYLADAQTAVQSVNGKVGQAVHIGVEDLSNVTGSATDGQALTKSGTNWMPVSVPTLSSDTANTGKAIDAHTGLPIGVVGGDAIQWALDPDTLITGAIARDANGAVTSAPVGWPDGDIGTFTAVTVSPTFLGAVDAYTITKVRGTVTYTYTQAAVTRNSNGAVTTRPAVTVA